MASDKNFEYLGKVSDGEFTPETTTLNIAVGAIAYLGT
jgi:hypothetical protein